jgi:hypothetical protein
MVIVPVRLPEAVGVKVTEIVHEPCRVAAHVVVSPKSPAGAIWAIESETEPGFVSVITWAALVVPTCWLAKEREVGDTVSDAPALAVATKPMT